MLGTGSVSGRAASGPGRIVYASKGMSASPMASFDLYVINADGSGRQLVRSTPRLDETMATWSPDGLRIAFQYGPAAEGGFTRIAVMGRAGGVRTVTPVSIRGAEFDAREPAWSPDGSRIVFAGTEQRGYHLYTVAPNGTGLAPLTDGRFDRKPTWSPDGRQIAFTRELALWVVNADGSGARQVAAGYFSDLAWAPDGSTIAFARSNRRTGANELYTIPAAGGPVRQLTRTPTTGESHPTWSPDGARIAYQYRWYDNAQIWVMNADGTGARALVTTGRANYYPSWTR